MPSRIVHVKQLKTYPRLGTTCRTLRGTGAEVIVNGGHVSNSSASDNEGNGVEHRR
jgi:hypothetical protein